MDDDDHVALEEDDDRHPRGSASEMKRYNRRKRQSEGSVRQRNGAIASHAFFLFISLSLTLFFSLFLQIPNLQITIGIVMSASDGRSSDTDSRERGFTSPWIHTGRSENKDATFTHSLFLSLSCARAIHYSPPFLLVLLFLLTNIHDDTTLPRTKGRRDALLHQQHRRTKTRTHSRSLPRNVSGGRARARTSSALF